MSFQYPQDFLDEVERLFPDKKRDADLYRAIGVGSFYNVDIILHAKYGEGGIGAQEALACLERHAQGDPGALGELRTTAQRVVDIIKLKDRHDSFRRSHEARVLPTAAPAVP